MYYYVGRKCNMISNDLLKENFLFHRSNVFYYVNESDTAIPIILTKREHPQAKYTNHPQPHARLKEVHSASADTICQPRKLSGTMWVRQ